MKIAQQKGVTLIILVITIAILLILAGVTINTAFKKGGMMKSAEQFSNDLETEQNKKDEEVNDLIENIDGILHEESVARIGSNRYETLQKAIDSVKTDNNQVTITLLKDIKENVTIKEKQNILLDLANKKIENSTQDYVIKNSGTLEIKNGNIRK